MSDETPRKIPRKTWEPFHGLKITPPAEEESKDPEIRDYQQKRYRHEYEGGPEPTAPERPVVLNAPLFGGRKELGKLPYQYAGPVNMALNTLYGMKTKPFYGAGITAPFAAGIDAYESAKRIQENPYSISSYTGLLPIARSGSPIMGVAGGAGAAYAASQGEEPEAQVDRNRSPVFRQGADEMDAMRLANGITDPDRFSQMINRGKDEYHAWSPDQNWEEPAVMRGTGGKTNSILDKNPEWRMSLGRGGEHDVQDALRLAREGLRKGGRPQGPAFMPQFGSDREAMIRTMLAEARGEGQKGMEAVGYNLRNRADANYGKYGSSIAEQALGRKPGSNFGEYSSWNPRGGPNQAGKNALKISENDPSYKQAAAATDTVMGRMEQDPTMGASNYRNSAFSSQKSNQWFNKLQDKVDIGHHTFGRAPGFHVPESNATPQIGDAAMMQKPGPSPQAMQMAGLQGPTNVPQGVPSTMMAQAAGAPPVSQQAPTQMAKASAPAPMQMAKAEPITPPTGPTPTTPSAKPPQMAAEINVGKPPQQPPMEMPKAPEQAVAGDTQPGAPQEDTQQNFLQGEGVGMPEAAPEAPAPEMPDMTAGLENMFMARGGLVSHALKIAHDAMNKGGGAWTRKEGQNPKGGLNAKGRASLKAQGHDIKPPQPEGGPRKNSFCARMKGMKRENTSAETANDPNSRINKSLRAWNCHADGGPVWDKPRPKGLGKPHELSSSQKASAKASAKAAGRPYPNLIDNMRAAKK